MSYKLPHLRKFHSPPLDSKHPPPTRFFTPGRAGPAFRGRWDTTNWSRTDETPQRTLPGKDDSESLPFSRGLPPRAAKISDPPGEQRGPAASALLAPGSLAPGSLPPVAGPRPRWPPPGLSLQPPPHRFPLQARRRLGIPQLSPLNFQPTRPTAPAPQESTRPQSNSWTHPTPTDRRLRAFLLRIY